MGHVGAEARGQLLKGFVVVAVEGEGGAVAVLVDVALEDRRFLEARPVEDGQFGIGGQGKGRRGKGERDGGGAQEGHGQTPVLVLGQDASGAPPTGQAGMRQGRAAGAVGIA